jgi:uncharacterized protein YkwD
MARLDCNGEERLALQWRTAAVGAVSVAWLGRAAVVLAIAAVTVVSGLSTGAGLAWTEGRCDVVDTTMDSEEQAFLRLINAYRMQHALGPLSLSGSLNRSASWMAKDLATGNYFGHQDSGGRSPSTRAAHCGYPQGAGENLAAGKSWSTAQKAFDAWKGSAEHNANMLTRSYRQIGIARHYGNSSNYGWYWVTNFGNTNDGTEARGGGLKSAMIRPAPGANISGRNATFSWDTGSDVKEYFLYVGTVAGGNDIHGQSAGTALSVKLEGLPADGRPLYVRLWSRVGGGWQYTDYTYGASTAERTEQPTFGWAPGHVALLARPWSAWRQERAAFPRSR